MRYMRRVMFIIDSDDPSVDLDSVLEDGAEANGYNIEEFDVSEATADGYIRLKKE